LGCIIEYGCYNSKPDISDISNIFSDILDFPDISDIPKPDISKAGGCRAVQLLGGFRRNLQIVSWVTPTPGCTAKFSFLGNRYMYSQLLILRPFSRSGQALLVEYQVEPFSINFPMSTSKKCFRQGPVFGNSMYTGIPSQRTISQRQYQYQNHRKIT
jgi:hypothetical protein